jgi:hypothetical protein
VVKRFALGALLAVGTLGLGWVPAAKAQLAACQPPAAEEYLLLVLGRTADAQAKTFAALPAGSVANVCVYQGETVVRVNGFSTQETANAWAQYLTDKIGVQTFVARPGVPAAPLPVAPQAPQVPQVPTQVPGLPSAGGYNPQPLGNGYAVLVNYYNRPEVALQLQQTLGRPVGLVSYAQRPYLLASYTTDQNNATALLGQLSGQGYVVTIVDGRRAVLLRGETAK